MAWNGSDLKGAAAPRADLQRKKHVRGVRSGVLAGLIVIVLGGAGVWLFWGGFGGARPKVTDEKSPTNGKITEVKAQIVTNAVAREVVAPKTNDLVATALPTNDRVHAVHNKESVIILADGTKLERPKQIFHKPVERLLNRALVPSSPGSMPGAMTFANRYTDAQLMAMMREKVQINPTDSDRAVKAKQELQNLKDRVLEHVAAGGDVRDIFQEIDDQAFQEHKERHISDVGLRSVRKFGDPEVAKYWVEKRNAKLREMGMSEIRVPAEFTQEQKQTKQDSKKE